MDMNLLRGCAVATLTTLAAFSSAFAQLADESDYLDTQQGMRAAHLKLAEVSPSLMLALPASEQQVRRHPGAASADLLLRQNAHQKEQASRGQVGNWLLLPTKPQKMMPYLDSLFILGNNCVEPCAIVGHDDLSSAAQRIKTAASTWGIYYDLTIDFNYTGVTPQARGTRASFSSFDNELWAAWYLAKSRDNSQGIFLMVEADWGVGTNYNENNSSAQASIGSLSMPQSALRGGEGVFLPNVSLGYSACDGKFVVMAGTLDTTNFLDQNVYSADWNGNLLNESFNYSPTLPLKWANWGYLSAWQPCKEFYALYATTGIRTEPNQNPFSDISSNYWVHVAEFGYVRDDLWGWGPGTYRFQYCITENDGRTGAGAALNLQQQLGKDSQLGFFTRLGWNDEDAASVTGVSQAVTAGLVLQAPFTSSGWGSRSNNDQVAFGFLWERAADSEAPFVHRNEYGLELSAVIQLTPTLFLQPDVQYIIDPVHSTGKDRAFVFQLQSTLRF